jgi:release factor glutamine methyltransferase
VYEPCDGSFALVDALLSERANLRDLQPSLCVEVGSGSGYVLTSLARMLADETNNTEYIATDLNEDSVSTLSTLRSHQICGGETFVADFVSGSEDQLAGSVDVLIFNPPYVLTYEEEEEEEEDAVDGITGTCSGGDQGRTVINRMLMITDTLLSSKGLLYLLTTTGNNPGEICQIMKKKGFESRIVIQRFTDEESLHVLKFWRKSTFKECSSPGTSSPLRFLVSILPRYLSKFLSWFVVFKE